MKLWKFALFLGAALAGPGWHNRGMMKLQITETGDQLGEVPRRVRTAMAQAVTGLAFDVRDALRQEMADVFDKPNAFTLNAFRVAPATGDDPTAVVWAMPRQANYLRPEIEGGKRGSKGFEHKLKLFGGRVAVPVGRFDSQFERSPKGFVSRMIRDIESGSNSGRYFVGSPKGRTDSEGVWARAGRGGKRLLKVMSFEDQATYDSALDPRAVAVEQAGKTWESQLLRAMAKN